MNEFHTPVLLKEVVEFLDVRPGKKYVDATVGGGGHSWEILKRGGKVLGLDVDPEAIKHVARRIWHVAGDELRVIEAEGQATRNGLTLYRGNFAHLKEIAQKFGFGKVSGVLFDLGASAHQLLTPERGFSFRSNFPLDMRMDPDLVVTAADLVNGLNVGELYELFSKLGEEHLARSIAEAIVRARRIKKIETCRELAEIILRALPGRRRRDRVPAWPAGKHPATRCFQALRIAVNDELNNLKAALPQAVELLEDKGRLVVISFHSLEDRIVKKFLKEKEDILILTKKPIRPTKEAVEKNPRSRSAKMRVGEKRKMAKTGVGG